MPSRSNPNVPSSLKPKTARTLKTKRQSTQHLARHKRNGTAAPRTSQAIRKAAPMSNKKARKLETKKLHARRRALEEGMRAGEVEMRDMGVTRRSKEGDDERQGGGVVVDAEGVEEMVIDQGTG